MEKGKTLLSLLRAEIMGERAEILSDFIEISALMNMAKKQDFLQVLFVETCQSIGFDRWTVAYHPPRQ